MAKNYQWSAGLTVESGGYAGETITIENNGTVLFSGSIDSPPQSFIVGWTTTSAPTGSRTYTYTYLDSDTASNTKATKVSVTLSDSWTVTIDSRNYMTVSVDTVLVSADRSVIGAPGTQDSRHLWMRREPNGADFSPFPLVDNASTLHNIASNINLGNYSFTLAPGEEASRASVYWRSTTVGYENVPLPNIYSDILWIGVHFKNILPKETIPHAVLDGSGHWLSHNRNGGDLRLLSGARWTDNLMNSGGGVDYGNPPSVMKGGKWINARTFGQE